MVSSKDSKKSSVKSHIGYAYKNNRVLKVFKKNNIKVFYDNKKVGDRIVYKTKEAARKRIKKSPKKSKKTTKKSPRKSTTKSKTSPSRKKSSSKTKKNSWIISIKKAKEKNPKWKGIPKKNSEFYKATKKIQKKLEKKRN